jgi:hypothetical protein
VSDKTISGKKLADSAMQPTSLHTLCDGMTKHRKQRGYEENSTYSIPTIVNGQLLTEDNRFAPIRNDKSIK